MAPPFRFGLLTDIQNADKDNTYFEGRTRHHREVPAKLSAAVDALLSAHAAPGPAPSANGGLVAVVSLGDLVDGYPDDPRDRELSLRDLGAVLGELARLEAAGAPLRHAIGNHDLAVPRDELIAALKLPEGSNGYYSAPLAPGWRLVVLDTNDVSIYSYGKGTPQVAEAAAWLERLRAAGAPNAMPWNGGVSGAQLAWLRAEVAAAAAAGERVVAACHHPLMAGSAPDHYLAWNAADVVAAFDAHPGTVALVLQGHFHAGGAIERNGTHYVTLEGLVEAPIGDVSYAVVEVADDSIVIRAGGYASTRTLPIARRAPAAGGAAVATASAVAAEAKPAPAAGGASPVLRAAGRAAVVAA